MKKYLIASLVLLNSSFAFSHDYESVRPDSHAPYGVMGDHTHKLGEVMLSYRFMRMEMNDNRDGTDRLSDSEVLADFPVAPRKMTMDMHMFGAMYAPNNKLTLMVMVPLLNISMDHVTRTGGEFTTKTDGFGDVKLSGLYSLYEHGNHRVHLNAGISLPTGSVDERDDTPIMANAILPYPMQLGSGTYDLLPGITYNGQTVAWSWGAQLSGVVRLGENDEDYTLGNKIELTGWVAHKWNDHISTSFRLAGQNWGNIDGSDDRLNPNMVPTADTDRRGGDRVDALVGINYKMAGFRISAEVGAPVYQHLDGPQLETDWIGTIGMQYAF